MSHSKKSNLSIRDKSELKEDPSKGWIYAVGHIHGDDAKLVQMISKIEETGLAANDKIIFLGNLIGKQGDSHRTLAILKEYKSLRPDQVQIIRGANEQHFVQSRAPFFSSDVGKSISYSYRSGPSHILKARFGSPNVLGMLEDRHWLNTLPCYLQTEKYFFVSSGVSPHMTLAKQPIGCFMFIGQPFYESNVVFDKVVVYSYPAEKQEIKNNRIGIAWNEKELSCVVLNDKMSLAGNGSIKTIGKTVEGLLRVAS